jgi:MFS transporter, OPA family, sugar phosphate sensor protein UhpC
MTNESLRSWRIRIFVLTWVAYAGFYLCRKNFSVLMPLLRQHTGISNNELANAIFGYSLMYSIGQFVMGTMSDRFGPRLVVTGGMLVAGTTSVLMAFNTDTLSVTILQAINGLAQACGWSGLLKIMSAWFEAKNRGVVMGWWCTNYALGAFLATTFATFAATSSLLFLPSWQRGAWLPGALLIVLALVFAVLVRNGPLSVETPAEARQSLRKFLAVTKNAQIRVVAGAYFCLKLTRYSFLFWLPLYLTERLGFSAGEAGYSSSVFELGGFLGVVGSGYISDRLFQARRFPVACLMTTGLGFACLLPVLAGTVGTWLIVPSIALIGLLNLGPDTLLGGATVQDASTRESAATTAGFVNGTGSMGQFLSPYIVANVVEHFGWNALFVFFFAVSVAGGLLLSLKWNYRVPEEKVTVCLDTAQTSP